jgi:hypothetical protein
VKKHQVKIYRVKRMKIKYLKQSLAGIVLFSIFSLVPAHAQIGIEPVKINRAGQSGWQFLKINSDPIQAAMGGAYAAISRGNANAVFGNPASLVDVANLDVQLNSVSWIADIQHSSAAVAKSVGGIGVFAVSVAVMDYGDIPETMNQLSPAGDRTQAIVTGSHFTAGDLAMGISYAKKVTDRLSLGGNVRWIRESIAELNMNNWSLDFGTLYYTGFRSLRLAIAARNFGPDSHLLGWSEEYQSEPVDVRMPIDVRLGMAMDFFDGGQSPHRMTLVLEGDHPNDGAEKIHLGLDYSFQKMFVLRGGYRFNYDVQGLTLGLGLLYALGQYSGQVNYAYVDFGALKQVHLISLGFTLN